MLTSVKQYDITIVGAGPVGLTLASLLGSAGLDILVLEQGDRLSPESRASTFQPATLDLLDRLDVTSEMLSRGYACSTLQYRERAGGILCELDLPDLIGDKTNHPYRLQFEQSRYTELLRQKLKEVSNVAIQFSRRVESVVQLGDQVRVSARDDSEQMHEYLSRYVVGTDGAHSSVRASLSIEFPGNLYPKQYLMILVTDDPGRYLTDLAGVSYVADPAEAVSVLRLADHWRLVFAVPASLDTEVVMSNGFARDRLVHFLGPDHNVSTRSTRLYRLHERVATSFYRGNIAIIGDAAHLNNPTGGMGMNSGIHDAWELAAALIGILREGANQSDFGEALDSRRKIATESVIPRAEAQFAFSSAGDEHSAYITKMETIASDRALAESFAVEISMLDIAPRP